MAPDLPQALTKEGIFRSRFYGLSCGSIASIRPGHLGPTSQGRIVVAHLGSGANMCAMKNGHSVATSMALPREVASLAATIQGLYALVFTAGIYENSALVRARIYEKLGWMGVKTEAQANARTAAQISRPEGAVDVLVIPTNKEATIVRATRDLARAARPTERS